MPDEIPQSFPQPTREEIRDQWLRDYRYWSEGTINTDEGTEPWREASTFADQMVPAYLRLDQSSDNIVLRKARGKAAEDWAESKGLERRIEATGGGGFVNITTSVGGATIYAGDELKFTPNNLRFKCAETGTYTTSTPVPITGIDTGPVTNLPAGTQLVWTAPRPGCAPLATVRESASGEGLSGGRLAETDEEIIARVIDAGRNPPAGFNGAHVRRMVLETPGLAVQAAFTFEAIFGPGSIGIVFTMQPSKLGGSRLPNNAHLAQVEAWLSNQMGDNDSVFVRPLLANKVDVTLRVSWQTDVDGWVDSTPWPPYYAGSGAVAVQTVTDATHFVLRRLVGGYVGVPSPVAGQTITFFDYNTRTFHAKRILTVTGTGPWTIVVDATHESSDLTYIPVVGQEAMPHSKSLPLVVDALLKEFDRFGPGEQVATFFDEGDRQRRMPAPPKVWPSVIGNRLINGVQDLAAIDDAELLAPATPLSTPVGAPGVRAYLHELQRVRIYALTT